MRTKTHNNSLWGYLNVNKWKVRVKYDHWLPKLFYLEAITLYPWILISYQKHECYPELFKHEMIHIEQCRRYTFICFYIAYITLFLWNFIKTFSVKEAYFNIPFEVEAYAKQDDKLTNVEQDELNIKVVKKRYKNKTVLKCIIK